MRYLIHFLIMICFAWVTSCASIAQTEPQLDPDQEVIDQLKKAGSDLSKTHEINFYLYFPSEEKAKSAAVEVQKEGLSVKVRPAAMGADWLCLGTKEMVPELSEMT